MCVGYAVFNSIPPRHPRLQFMSTQNVVLIGNKVFADIRLVKDLKEKNHPKFNDWYPY